MANVNINNHKLESRNYSTETGHNNTGGAAAHPTHSNNDNRSKCGAQETKVVYDEKATGDKTIVEKKV